MPSVSKDLKASPIRQSDKPPPYASIDDAPSATGAYGNTSVMITVRCHRPYELQNGQGGGQITRSLPETSSFRDAVLLENSMSGMRSKDAYSNFLAHIQQRASQKLSLCSSGTEMEGNLEFHPQKQEISGEKATVDVDAENWKAVEVMLAQGKGELVYKVVDVPRYWDIGWSSKSKLQSDVKGESAPKDIKEDRNQSAKCKGCVAM